jgi:hypothetical protein
MALRLGVELAPAVLVVPLPLLFEIAPKVEGTPNETRGCSSFKGGAGKIFVAELLVFPPSFVALWDNTNTIVRNLSHIGS